MRGVLLLFLLLGAAAGAASAPCGAGAIWSLCQQDRTCAWLFRKEGVDGVTAALAYHAATAVRGSGPWPAAWQALMEPAALFGGAVCVAATNASLGVAAAPSAEVALAVAVLTQLRGFMAAGEHGCVDPYEFPVYDSVTEQYACVCAEGHICNTSDDASVTTLSTNYVLFIVTLCLVGVVMLAALVAAPVMLCRATNAVLAAAASPEKEKR